jgi:hypothetical protein
MTSDIEALIERLRDGSDRFLKWAYKEPYSGPSVLSIPRHPDNIDALLTEAADALTATLKPQGVEAEPFGYYVESKASPGELWEWYGAHQREAAFTDYGDDDAWVIRPLYAHPQAVADAPSQDGARIITGLREAVDVKNGDDQPARVHVRPSQTSGEDVELTRGRVTWMSSGEDEGPDCGLVLGLGGGKALFLGEVSDALVEECGIEPGFPIDRWWIALQEKNSLRVIAPVADIETARELFAALSTQPSPTQETWTIDKQAFERYPALASWIERMANTGTSLSLGEWMIFLGALNHALTTAERQPSPTQAVADAPRQPGLSPALIQFLHERAEVLRAHAFTAGQNNYRYTSTAEAEASLEEAAEIDRLIADPVRSDQPRSAGDEQEAC